MKHFFSPKMEQFKWRTALRRRPESNYWGDAHVVHTQIIGGDTVKLLEGIYPPSPRVSAPLRAGLFGVG